MDSIHKREEEIKRLLTALQSNRAQLFYVRGRRRVGKSWILKELVKKRRGSTFYFAGSKDSNIRSTIRQFNLAWGQFCPSSSMHTSRTDRTGWRGVFEHVCRDLVSVKKKGGLKSTVILDEIQWIAKEEGGFTGALKEAWLDIERSSLAHIVICGSSNKFFSDHVGGEEKILRGLQTRSPFWVHPLSLFDVKKVFFPSWDEQQVALLYMLIGGIPYYLQQISNEIGFVHAINGGIFSADAIFCSETEEILGLDFNTKAMINVRAILQSLAVHGGSQSSSRAKTRLAPSSTSEIFAKLITYKLLERDLEFGKVETVAQNESSHYSIADFFLNTYFSLLLPIEKSIERNSSGRTQIFGSRILAGGAYYIQDFTGKMFERLVQFNLRAQSLESRLLTKLSLSSYDFSIYTINSAQFDLVVYDRSDRTARAIECKWAAHHDLNWLDQISKKKLPLAKGQSQQNVIVLSSSPTKLFRERAKKLRVQIIELADLFHQPVS